MSGPFGRCCDCGTTGTDCVFFVGRLVGGFAEYVITHATDNPVTFFAGRRYLDAEYTFALTNAFAATCGGAAMTCNSYYCDSFSFAHSSSYSALINDRSTGGSGNLVDGTAVDGSSLDFQTDGYYEAYTTRTFGLGQIIGDDVSLTFDAGSTATCSDYFPFAVDLCDSAHPSGIFQCNTGACCSETAVFPKPQCPGGGTNDCGEIGDCGASDTGGVPSSSGSISSTAFSGDGSRSCVITQCALSDAESGPGFSCNLFFSYSLNWTSTATGALTTEVDYDAIIDSCMAQISAAAALAQPVCVASVGDGGSFAGEEFGGLYGFNDYPTSDSHGSSTMPYDGSLVNGNVTESGPLPRFTSPDVYTAASYFWINLPDTPGDAAVDTWALFLVNQKNVSGPYILATYILMSDGSLVEDTYGGPTTDFCVDGAAFGFITIPQPSLKELPTSLYTISGDTLTGPIGRVVALITGTTCDTWDGTQPDFST